MDAREEGKAAAEVAVALARGAALDEIEGAEIFADGPEGVPLNSILLTPVSNTQDNLDVLVEAGWISTE